jgi:hypothetical protein
MVITIRQQKLGIIFNEKLIKNKEINIVSFIRKVDLANETTISPQVIHSYNGFITIGL